MIGCAARIRADPRSFRFMRGRRQRQCCRCDCGQHAGGRCRCCDHFTGAPSEPVKRGSGEAGIGKCTTGSIGPGEAAGSVDHHVAVNCRVAYPVADQRNAGDAHVSKRLEFTSFCHSVAVGILPNPELGEGRIAGAQHAIVIAVITDGQPLKVGQAVTAKDDFRAVVDNAIAVQVNRQQAVVPAGPGRAFGRAIAGIIESDPICPRCKFYPVTVEVEHDGRNIGRRDCQIARSRDIAVPVDHFNRDVENHWIDVLGRRAEIADLEGIAGHKPVFDAVVTVFRICCDDRTRQARSRLSGYPGHIDRSVAHQLHSEHVAVDRIVGCRRRHRDQRPRHAQIGDRNRLDSIDNAVANHIVAIGIVIGSHIDRGSARGLEQGGRSIGGIMPIEHVIAVGHRVVIAGTIGRIAAQVGNKINPEDLTGPDRSTAGDAARVGR